MVNKLNLSKSESLFAEAKKLSPGGVMGIRRPYNFVVGEYPVFIKEGYGGHIIDEDGNDYIDMLCAYGPIILGYVEPEINNEVIKQLSKGFCFSLVQKWQNILLQRLVDLIPCAEMGILVKTGSDAASCAVRIARGHTGRDKVIRCGYHGWHDWCVEVRGGVPKGTYQDTLEFHYNDLDGLKKLFAENKDQIACVIITGVGHPLNDPVVEPLEGFLEGVKSLCHENGAVFIMDEIRTGFRFGLGGAQQRYGVTPDLAVFGKALANGYPISVVLGKENIMKIAEKEVFISSTFFPNSLEMIAALKCLEIMEKEKVAEDIWKRGLEFNNRLEAIASKLPYKVTVSKVPPMPFVTFDRDDDGKYKDRRTQFYTGAIRRGLFIQPYHHWYIAYRHTDADLEKALNIIEESFKDTI